MNLKQIFDLLKTTFSEWKEDKVPRLAAALAYYTAFSLAPILVIAIAVVGLVYDRQAAQTLIADQMRSLAGEQGAELLGTMLSASQDMGSNLLATVLGIAALIFGATGVFGQLQDALNTMWEVAPRPDRGLWGVIKDRFFSFTMVIGVGFLLLVSLVISAALAALNEWALGLFPGFEVLVQVINFAVSFLVITVLFALLFKYVPDADIQWRDVWLGAAVTALLFTIGKFLIGLYLGSGGVTERFGAAGSLVVILLWVYYSAQISFFGAEFTQVYANRYGSRVVPDEDAVPISEEARREQGIPHREDFEAAARQGKPVSSQHSAAVPSGSAAAISKGTQPEQDTPPRGNLQTASRQGAPVSRPGYAADAPSSARTAQHARPLILVEQPPSSPAGRSLRLFGTLTAALLTLVGGYLIGLRSRPPR